VGTSDPTVVGRLPCRRALAAAALIVLAGGLVAAAPGPTPPVLATA
jgi:hypothetical protein